MEMMCENKRVDIKIEEGGRRSMLILGCSRMGKTICALGLAVYLICQGYLVNLIDFGMRWSLKDIRGLLAVGVKRRKVDAEGIVLIFASASELIDCSRIF